MDFYRSLPFFTRMQINFLFLSIHFSFSTHWLFCYLWPLWKYLCVFLFVCWNGFLFLLFRVEVSGVCFVFLLLHVCRILYRANQNEIENNTRHFIHNNIYLFFAYSFSLSLTFSFFFAELTVWVSLSVYGFFSSHLCICSSRTQKRKKKHTIN